MATIENILNYKVSYQPNTWSPISTELTIGTILDQIKTGKYKNQIEVLRKKLESGDVDYYDQFKKHLPAVTFSATFNSRRTKENITTYNSLIVLDIDELESLKLKSTYEDLLSDQYVISFWRSPSNNGFKGLVAINYKFEITGLDLEILHKNAFKKLSEYFFEKYSIELDKSGSDITRLCFLSCDNLLIQNKSVYCFELAQDEIIDTVKSQVKKNVKINFVSNLDSLYNPLGKNNQCNRKIMTDIIRCLKNKKLSITYKYEEWCRVAMAVSNSFTYEIGLKYFLKLSSLDIDKYNEIVCTNFLINCYETRKGNVNFSSIIYLANLKGYKTKYQRKGVPKAEVKLLSQISLS